MINSQHIEELMASMTSISKGMGDQFSARAVDLEGVEQYIKGDG